MTFRGAAERKATSTFELLSPSEIEALPDLNWLIAGVLPAPAFGVMYGEPGCGKTFAALSMALSVANGQFWLDRNVHKAKVLYIAAEGVLGLKTRLQAFRQSHGLTDDNVRFLAMPIEIMNPENVEDLLKALKTLGFNPGLIVVDTLARVALGANENDATDMGRVVAGFDELKKRTNATVLVIHHTTKNGTSERGSSALRGAADVMISCEKQGNKDSPGVFLKCAKMKDDEPFENLGATLEKTHLPCGKTSLVLGEKFDFLSAGSANADAIIGILNTEFSKVGATHTELKAAFLANTGASASTFARALKEIKKTKCVEVEKKGNVTRYSPAAQD